MKIVNGYAIIDRNWQKNDKVELMLPMQPRFVSANDSVELLQKKVAIASGPIIYGLEAEDNADLERLHVKSTGVMKTSFNPKILNGVNTISGEGVNEKGIRNKFLAVPFYSLGNRKPGELYQVWLPE